MADDHQFQNNWWDTTARNGNRTPPAPISIPATINSVGWPLDAKSRPDPFSIADERDDQGNFRSLIPQFDSSSSGSSFPQNLLHSGGAASEVVLSDDYRQINRGVFPDQRQFSYKASSNDSEVTSRSFSGGFNDGLSVIETQQTNHPMTYSYWNKHSDKQPLSDSHYFHFWNASAGMPDARSSLVTTLNDQTLTPSFDEKLKVLSEAKTMRKTRAETSNKRPRNETSSSSPACKVKKEKVGDRITALQQLVSPFGKTDTASVLSETIEYIKFLHEQVSALTIPYMKTGAQILHHHQQISDVSKNLEGTPCQGLRSRGLCLVPVSCTLPVTHETTVDFWTPTFGGTCT